MLPKVANHLLIHTSRAVAVVQNQTGHTLKSVLQVQSSNGASSGSGRSGHGPGSGGARFHSGSRYYSGYTGAGRAVTQVESITSNEVAQARNDDSDELHAKTVLPGRKPSTSVRPREHTAEKLNVLRTVQSHTAACRLFTEHPLLDHGKPAPILSTQNAALLLHIPPSQPTAARHESTLAAHQTVENYLDLLPPSSPLPSRPATPSARSELSPIPEPVTLPSSEVIEQDAFSSEALERLTALMNSRNVTMILQEVNELRNSKQKLSTAVYNLAFRILFQVRYPGQSLSIALDLYHDMLARSVLPDFDTYMALIIALTTRDTEIRDRIRLLESRIRTPLGKHTRERDHVVLKRLRAEDPFPSAITLFQTACAIPGTKLPLSIYTRLLRSCANHSNVDAAVHVFAHLEKRTDIRPSATIFQHLLRAFSSAGDLQGAKEVFDEFRKACQSGTIQPSKTDELDSGVMGTVDFVERAARIDVWNAMIEACIRSGQHEEALSFLELMLEAPEEMSTVTDVPPPAPSTFYCIITAFSEVGELNTALSWFERLLAQDVPPRNMYDASTTPSRPNAEIWNTMLHALASHGRIEDLTRLHKQWVAIATRDGMQVSDLDLSRIGFSSLDYLYAQSDLDHSHAFAILDFLVNTSVQTEVLRPTTARFTYKTVTSSVLDAYLKLGHVQQALQVAEQYVARLVLCSQNIHLTFEAGYTREAMEIVRDFVEAFIENVRSQYASEVPLQDLLSMVRLQRSVGLPISINVADLLGAYTSAKTAGQLTLTQRDWDDMVLYVATVAMGHHGLSLETILRDMADRGVDFPNQLITKQHVQNNLLKKYGQDGLQQMLSVGANAPIRFWLESDPKPRQEVSEEVEPIILADDEPKKAVIVNPKHNRLVDEHHSNSSRLDRISPLVAYARFEEGRERGVYPYPEVLARLISALGRFGEEQKMYSVYEAAQQVLASMEGDKKHQSAGWFLIEDHMIIGLANAGDVEGAHVHRERILQQGGAPSAEAYGALIHNVRDTTDDAQNAMALFQEAQEMNIVANSYIYNTIISKLAKARRADDALTLFHEMRSREIWPTSVTYGALIAACCRVGDVQSAETLFEEMIAQPNFKPRIPPYNTMMQVYTHTKPDRSRVLYYYNALMAAGVKPTPHTYKLLLDAYGTIEPIDNQAMDEVLHTVTSGSRPLVQSTHWASLINSYGCVQKDLDRALAIFESIPSHHSTSRASAPVLDAVVFEALINVLVTLRRTDLIPVYVGRMASLGVHMTAYIANLLIRGYASAGDIERARELFESLADPPEGVAAPHNHAPHDGETVKPSQVPVGAPVYREPSTWEAMVRAELGNGNRDRATALLERVQARKFPPAVYHRISGIMHDDYSLPGSPASSGAIC